jgi:hypothetical protein
MSLSLDTPVSLTLAALASVIVPSGLMETIESRLASIIGRESWDASFPLVRSCWIVVVPTIAPSGSRIGETVTETGNSVLSFRRRTVSTGPAFSPVRTFAKNPLLWSR